MHRTAIVILTLFLFGCGPQPASVKPSTSELVGHYTTKDKRAAAAMLDLRPDMTFTLVNWPDTNGSGTWEVRKNSITGQIEFCLTFQPQNYYVSGYQVLGGPGAYSLGFFVGDPDEGAVVLERQLASPATRSAG